jgi:tungstate transport system permease protein
VDALFNIISITLRVSLTALLIACAIGIPLGALIGLTRFPARRFVIAMIYTGMAFPPVVIGLVVYVLLSRNGLIGKLALPFVPSLFTIEAMIVAQVILALPLVIGVTMSEVMNVSKALRLQIRALGATPTQVALTTLREAKAGVVLAAVSGFGAAISEVGAVMLVGGNIENQTRTLTTAIVLETSKGEFDVALPLGALLLTIAFVVNALAIRLQGRSLDA